MKNIPKNTRIRRKHLSFYNLSLILERGRPAAKRVVVGSDNVESITEAQQTGYETNILERVAKAKPLNSKKIRKQDVGNSSSGSETSPVFGPVKMVEQAVDEILHLKMCESVLDTEVPSTMVVATGDAAEAEYSGGFLKMLERALLKKWKVEIIAFRLNTSSAYRKSEWKSRWGSAFRVIELDDYTNALLLED